MPLDPRPRSIRLSNQAFKERVAGQAVNIAAAVVQHPNFDAASAAECQAALDMITESVAGMIPA